MRFNQCSSVYDVIRVKALLNQLLNKVSLPGDTSKICSAKVPIALRRI